ncbi:MAG: signal recognition particle protein [Candidatus Firestonebacteria bacterium]|nr:signal recognition particle protein [Candidatus Firestonebacteria bacterium]
MFDNLTDKFQNIFKKIKGEGKLNEKNIQEAIREVKIALLEADVNFKVVKDFVENVKNKALGQEVLNSLLPGQLFVKIVHDELISLLGSTQTRVSMSSGPQTVVMMVGLQGVGKTTAAGKLALRFRKDGHRPLLVAADIYRPSAVDQLTILGKQINVPVFSLPEKDVVKICTSAQDYAFSFNCNILVIDTAGRLHIDIEMMDELKRLKTAIHPNEILLVLDAMTGQEAVHIGGNFNNELGIDGVILTKLDGDARGGSALSIKAVINKPIKFIGTGEKVEALEPFHPERMANRILGMGDIVSLVEKAQEAYENKEAEELSKKILGNKFDFEDFLTQLKFIKKMGPMENILSMLPGASNLKNIKVDPKQFTRTEAIIYSMTLKERRNPKIINGSRRSRIARGSGTTVQDVNRLLKQFDQMKDMIKRVGKMKSINELKNLGI